MNSTETYFRVDPEQSYVWSCVLLIGFFFAVLDTQISKLIINVRKNQRYNAGSSA